MARRLKHIKLYEMVRRGQQQQRKVNSLFKTQSTKKSEWAPEGEQLVLEETFRVGVRGPP
jgi:hypothetical protein